MCLATDLKCQHFFEHVSTLAVVLILGTVFSKLATTFSLLKIFEHRLLRWKLDFRRYKIRLKYFFIWTCEG